MTGFKFWRVATTIVALSLFATACQGGEEASAGKAEASSSPSSSPSEEGCLTWSVPCSRGPSGSPTPEVWPPVSELSYKSAAVRLPGKGWTAVPEGEDMAVMPAGALDERISKSAALVYDERYPEYRLSKATVSLEIHSYDPHAEGNDLDVDYMRREVAKIALDIQEGGGPVNQEPSITKDGVVYDVIASGDKSGLKKNHNKILTWRWEYIGVVMRKGGNGAAGIKTVIECRGEFYSEKKCAKLANDVFATLRVKKQ
ncbi:hypothetical protein ACFV9G_27030 [Nocardioides sp. NPDC059952]|uniref:hypothetical protein n=1 Tax=Nocardioides sp. NPDC059952 TaxID=3347014 RepID=UPI0036545713